MRSPLPSALIPQTRLPITPDIQTRRRYAAILAADGADSGLDADLLDGQHASAFAQAVTVIMPCIHESRGG